LRRSRSDRSGSPIIVAPPLLYLERAHVLIVFALPSKALAIADAPGLAPA
jgi:hypothetical protein